ncbi:hypothetical protein C8Q74DRAFT_256273 [Fomes fomentarius]|nr:hypothetical protein C8Q74DRAFT_256273 [Fomes fomentarius]
MSSEEKLAFFKEVQEATKVARDLRECINNNGERIKTLDRQWDSETTLYPSWAAIGEDYEKLLKQSQDAAIGIAAKISYYLSIQYDMRDSSAVDTMIAELDSLDEELQSLSFDGLKQSSEALESRLEGFAREFEALVKRLSDTLDRVPRAQEVGGSLSDRAPLPGPIAQPGHTSKDYQHGPGTQLQRLQETPHQDSADSTDPRPAQNRPQSLLQMVLKILLWFATPDDYSPTTLQSNSRSAPTTPVPQRPSLKDEFSVKIAVLDITSTIESATSAIRAMGIKLREVSKLRDTIIVDIFHKLSKEIKRYLDALRDFKANPSLENQKALRSIHQRVLSSSTIWKSREEILVNGYIKQL